ncbi:CSC1-like protein [Nymphaea thermarum]|nr:CSC1-like protein [Nymphaea thermarum]
MTTMQDLAVPAVINILVTFASLLAFALLRSQPINDRVYLPKSYINGRRKSTRSSEGLGPKLVNLKLTTFLKFLNSIPEALEKEKKDIIKHDGVDSAAYLRLYLLGTTVFQICEEERKVLKNPLPVAFVSFNSRLGAAICAQTQQCKNPYWLTDSVADERDVYWQNLVIPFVSLIIRRLVIAVSIFALMVFCMIPIAIVLSLANLDGLAKVAPFLTRVNELKVIKSFLQGFLPGLALKIFLFFLGKILTAMSIAEGHMLLSKIHTIAADKHYYFILVNVFLGSIVSGTVFQQLNSFPHQPPSE